MAEWLGRLTRNQMGSSRASSNLVDCVVFLGGNKIRKHTISTRCSKTLNCRGNQPFGLSSHFRVVKASD